MIPYRFAQAATLIGKPRASGDDPVGFMGSPRVER